MTSSWQKRRSAFNHDWLKNQYLPALAKLINIIDSEVEDPEFPRFFVHLTFPQWEQRREEVLSIIRDSEHSISPQILFHSSQLSNCDAYTKSWASELRSLALAQEVFNSRRSGQRIRHS